MAQTATVLKTFPSKFPSTCIACRQRIETGQLIQWSGRGKAQHDNCEEARAEREAKQPVLITVSPKAQTVPQPVQTKQPETADADALKQIAQALAPLMPTPTIDRDVIRDMIETALATAEPRSVRVIIENRTSGTVAQTERGDHENMAQLLYLLSKRHHAYLYGPPGSGKSTAAQRAAERFKLPYGYISLNPQTTDSRLIGYMDANRNFHETVFYNCYKNGGVFCIDEMDNSSPSLLTTLNGALENGHCAFPCGLVEKHKDFVLVATGNTCGRGGNAQFPDRRPFDAAFGERFTFIQWDYDTDLERAVTLAINPDATEWLNWIRKLRSYCIQNYPRVLVSPRASFKGAEYLKDSALTVEQIADAVIFKGIDAATRQAILRVHPLPEAN